MTDQADSSIAQARNASFETTNERPIWPPLESEATSRANRPLPVAMFKTLPASEQAKMVCGFSPPF